MSAGVRRAWQDMGRDGFLSAAVMVVFLVWTIPVALYLDVGSAGQSAASWLATSAIASFLVVGLLICVRLVTRSRWPAGPGPVRALTLYLAAGALRGVLLAGLAEQWELSTSVGALSRITQSAVWAAGLMGSVSIIDTRWHRHRQVMSHLASRQEDLLALQSSLAERIEQTHNELIERVHHELGPTLAALRAHLDALASSSDARLTLAVDGFRTAVADVVRPLSRELAEPAPATSATTPAAARAAPPLASIRTPLAAAIKPGASAGLLLTLTTLTALAMAPQEYREVDTVLRLGLLAGVLWLALSAWKWLARRRQWHPTIPVMGVVVPVILAVTAIVDGLVVRALTSSLREPAVAVPALAVLLAFLTPLLVSTAVVLQDLATAGEHQRADIVAQLETLTAVLRRELWRERRRLALTVHGPIQSALVAAAITLSRPGFRPDQIPALAATLDQAMTHIDRSTGPIPPVAACARELAALWVNTALVTFSSTDEATHIIDHDEALRAAVVEVMREGTSNAIRHGAADTVLITIEWDPKGQLSIVIHDDGDGPPQSSKPGLGSTMFDEISSNWQLTSSGFGTRLSVELATDATPPKVMSTLP